MSATIRIGVAIFWAGLMCAPALGQGTAQTADPLAKPAPLPPPPAATAVAATVNSQAIPELAVYRVLRDEPPRNWPEARKEILAFLVGNILIDQYLLAAKVAVDPKDVEKKLEEMKKEAEKEKQDWGKLLQSMFLSEVELRQQLTCALRWDKFCDQQATEAALKDLFDKNRSIFDGSQVRARHILVTGPADVSRAKLLTLRKEIDAHVAQDLGKLPPQTSNVDRDKARIQAIDKAFADAAVKISECPSKKMGGDLGWFPRNGAMVEPFARTAFEMKPYQMSDVVATEFGYHVILTTDYKAGKDVKYDEVKPVVREVFCDRLREALIADLKPRAQIVMAPAPK